jgi:exodeoxyribonuclease-3
MKIASWNVNGIRAILKKGNLQEFLAVEQPDIICLQEIKGEKSLIDIDFKDYFEYWNPAERKGYSGTAVFSKTEPLSVTYNFPEDFCKDSKLEDEFGHTNTEGRIITVEYKNFFLVTVYTPNVKRSLERLGLRHSEWDKLFLKYLKKLESKKPVIFCGDLNVAYTENDLARPKDNIGNAGFTNEERSGFGEYLKADFVDTWPNRFQCRLHLNRHRILRVFYFPIFSNISRKAYPTRCVLVPVSPNSFSHLVYTQSLGKSFYTLQL